MYIERGDTPMNATDAGGIGGRRKILGSRKVAEKGGADGDRLSCNA